MVFIGSAPKHHCLIPDVNLTEEWRNAIIPAKTVDGELVESQCSRYSLGIVKNLSESGLIPGKDVNLTSLSQEPCLDGWTYSKEIYQSNIVTEWDLVCDDQWKVPFASSSLFVGYLLGSLISGQLSDSTTRQEKTTSVTVPFGRKKVVFVSLAAQCFSVLLQSFSHSWRMFCVMFLFVGASQISLYISAFVLGTELLSKTMRVIFTTLGAFLFYCIGYMTLPWIAFAIREWRPLLAVLAATSVVYIPLWWMAINIGYFGLSLNTSNLSGDPFMNCFLSATSELPAYVVSTWLLKKCPRRPLLSLFLLIGGGVLLLIQVIPERTYNKILPYIVMGSLTMVSCVVNFFLPETLNKDLPETIDQMQRCKGFCHRPKKEKCLENGANGCVSLH
ncbi:hypothetical protein WMY93_007525 [Mugilogobius chulae]|uniref:Major facilitator superfamily (MFS) profile domain-containing protein n=1 Tax=Mugilogobius chulae TaxID=88201 RepID=A0AAW0PM29_9GOBI